MAKRRKSEPFYAPEGFIALRNGIFEHLESGNMTPQMTVVFLILLKRASFYTGIAWSSAPDIVAASGGNIPLDTATWCLRQLNERGYIKSLHEQGSRHNYAILVNKYEPTLGHLAHKSLQLDAQRSASFSKIVYRIATSRVLLTGDTTVTCHVSPRGRHVELMGEPTLTPREGHGEATCSQEDKTVNTETQEEFLEGEDPEHSISLSRTGERNSVLDSNPTATKAKPRNFHLDDEDLDAPLAAHNSPTPVSVSSVVVTPSPVATTPPPAPAAPPPVSPALRLARLMRGFLVGIEETDRRWEAGYVSAFQQILDRHQYTEIEQTINFLYTSDDDQAFFWRPKVKSADYLNRKFEQIHQAKDASILKRKADARAEAEMQKSYVERGGRPSGSHHDDGLVGRRILDRL